MLFSTPELTQKTPSKLVTNWCGPILLQTRVQSDRQRAQKDLQVPAAAKTAQNYSGENNIHLSQPLAEPRQFLNLLEYALYTKSAVFGESPAPVAVPENTMIYC